LDEVKDRNGTDLLEAEPVNLPVDGVLDLHTFAPRDVSSVVEEYLNTCRSERVLAVRIIHGKGKGVQKKIVRSVLEGLDFIEEFGDAPETAGGWGATIATLKPHRDEPPRP